MGTHAQFETLLRDIEPSPTTKKNASGAHRTLRAYLAAHEDFKSVHLDTFLAGSYRRDTSIRPRRIGDREARPDIDIIAVTNHTRDDDPKAVLTLLRSCLAEEYTLDDKPHDRSVGVITEQVEMDVVPIIAPYGMEGTLYLPDKRLKEWIETNPPGHTAWATEVNKAAGDRFKPLVKLFKWWRRESPTISKRPKGFVIECIVADCMDRGEKSYPELFIGTLESIVRRYAFDVALKQVPRIEDPGVPGNSVTARLSFDAFEGFYNKAMAHAELGRRAMDEEDAEESLEMWRKIFGPRFPAGPARTAAKSLLSAPATPSAFSFPDRPIIPRKPGGFA